MAKFYVRIEIEYEIEADNAEAALGQCQYLAVPNLTQYPNTTVSILNSDVFDEDMNFVE